MRPALVYNGGACCHAPCLRGLVRQGLEVPFRVSLKMLEKEIYELIRSPILLWFF